jgi:hypothetical protein
MTATKVSSAVVCYYCLLVNWSIQFAFAFENKK